MEMNDCTPSPKRETTQDQYCYSITESINLFKNNDVDDELKRLYYQDKKRHDFLQKDNNWLPLFLTASLNMLFNGSRGVYKDDVFYEKRLLRVLKKWNLLDAVKKMYYEGAKMEDIYKLAVNTQLLLIRKYKSDKAHKRYFSEKICERFESKLPTINIERALFFWSLLKYNLDTCCRGLRTKSVYIGQSTP